MDGWMDWLGKQMEKLIDEVEDRYTLTSALGWRKKKGFSTGDLQKKK